MERNSPCTAAESPNAQAMKCYDVHTAVAVQFYRQFILCFRFGGHVNSNNARPLLTNLSVPPRTTSSICVLPLFFRGSASSSSVIALVELVVIVCGTHLNRRSATAASKLNLP
eukprot:scaffold8_cov142-Skeletonema_marinoi.AAC.11